MPDISPAAQPQPSPLLERVRDRIRVRHYSIRTEHAYVDWVRRFILFQGRRHPSDTAAEEVGAFLTDLAVKGNVAASIQNEALMEVVPLRVKNVDFRMREILVRDGKGEKIE